MLAALLNRLNVPHAWDVPMGPLTWYGVGGCARVLARPSSEQQLAQLLAGCYQQMDVYLLGSGANLLVRDAGVPGLVIRLDHAGFKSLDVQGQEVQVGAGHDLARLILKLAGRGLKGLECLAGIPASVGGAIRMNAGGAFGSIGPLVSQVRVMDHQGQVRTLGRDDLQFGYRQSNIQEPVILEASFELTHDDPAALRSEVKKVFDYKKRTQPLGENSAGCAFKNPQPAGKGSHRPCPADQFLPGAGQLIDQAGLKGFRIGAAMVSHRHANFVVVDRQADARADDVLAVIQHVQAQVERRFGIRLEREVVVWPG